MGWFLTRLDWICLVFIQVAPKLLLSSMSLSQLSHIEASWTGTITSNQCAPESHNIAVKSTYHEGRLNVRAYGLTKSCIWSCSCIGRSKKPNQSREVDSASKDQASYNFGGVLLQPRWPRGVRVRHGLHARISRECAVRRDASYACVVPKGIFLERQFLLPRSKPSDPSAGRDILE